MKPLRSNKYHHIRKPIIVVTTGAALLALVAGLFWLWPPSNLSLSSLSHVATIAGTKGEFAEPFGIAVKGDDIYISDGQQGKIWVIKGGSFSVFAEGLDTPSAIAFDKPGDLIVADSGSNTIKSVDPTGHITLVAGVEGRSGSADGNPAAALLNAPIGVAVGSDGKIFIADTYNDRIRVIEGGKVSTLAGSVKGFADGVGEQAKFNTPCGLAIWQDKLLVADAGDRRIRVVEPDGSVWTLAGNGDSELKDGLLSESSFVQPTAVAVDKTGVIFVADGNAIRQIGGTAFPAVRTISGGRRGLKDGNALRSRFNRPSGLALDGRGDLLITDSENRVVRLFSSQTTGHEITAEEIELRRDKPEEFRLKQPARWPYDPPTAKRDIAGTLGEIRGEIKSGNDDDLHFHNGLDISGAYGETARFIRDEKVLLPIAVDNFAALRESLRMPTLGYIHVRLGRNSAEVPFSDPRFQFERDKAGKITGVRIPRGTKFKAGEPIGTLNSMNHVHLIAGRSGAEMNALDALIFPNIADSRSPTIEKVMLFDQTWHEIGAGSRAKLTGKARIVVRAYDQADGNAERRRLGVYKLGYQILKADGSPGTQIKWTIVFDRLPAAASIFVAYAYGSKSGPTGDTIFNYIVTDNVRGDDFSEDFLDPATLTAGVYTLRVFVADYFGNISSKDTAIEVLK